MGESNRKIHALVSFFLIDRNKTEPFALMSIAEIPLLTVTTAPSLMITKAMVFIASHTRPQEPYESYSKQVERCSCISGQPFFFPFCYPGAMVKSWEAIEN